MELGIVFYGWMVSAKTGLKATLLPAWVAVEVEVEGGVAG